MSPRCGGNSHLEHHGVAEEHSEGRCEEASDEGDYDELVGVFGVPINGADDLAVIVVDPLHAHRDEPCHIDIIDIII